MRALGSVLQQVMLGLSAISTGLLTGAMLFIGLSVAPWLRSLPPAEFHTWVLSYGPAIWRATPIRKAENSRPIRYVRWPGVTATM